MSADIHSISRLTDCREITLERFGDIDGTFCCVENGPISPLDYDVKRVYYLFDVPSQASRGGHSHRAQTTLIIAASGSFDVTIDDGTETRTVTLNRPDRGLLITPGIWRTLCNFSSGAVCMVLSSGEYSEADYVRGYDEFMTLTAEKR